jgi:trehalose 6-phosphate synthase
MAGDSELLILSNRGPLSMHRGSDGTLAARRGGGGLVVTLGPGAERDAALWVAAAVGPDDEEAARRGLFGAAGQGFTVRPVVVDPADYRAYYGVVANQTLWFCLHGLWDLPRRPRFDRHWWTAWERFRDVNELFAAAASEAAAPGATVLVQDYQLALVPALLAERRPDLRSAAFVHTPWCSPQEMAVLPDAVAAEILNGLAGAGACGFHSARWADAFAQCCQERLGRVPVTYVSPAATDVDDLRAVAASPECARELARLNAAIGERRLIVRVDRIEL